MNLVYHNYLARKYCDTCKFAKLLKFDPSEECIIQTAVSGFFTSQIYMLWKSTSIFSSFLWLLICKSMIHLSNVNAKKHDVVAKGTKQDIKQNLFCKARPDILFPQTWNVCINSSSVAFQSKLFHFINLDVIISK